MREFVLDRVASGQSDRYFPDVVTIRIRHGGTIATPAVEGAIDFRSRKAARVIVHVYLEGDIGLCKGTPKYGQSQNSQGFFHEK